MHLPTYASSPTGVAAQNVTQLHLLLANKQHGRTAAALSLSALWGVLYLQEEKVIPALENADSFQKKQSSKIVGQNEKEELRLQRFLLSA